MKTRTEVSAGGVVFDGEGRIALTSRRPFGGKLTWGLPKGLVEKGEQLHETALREAREETGLEVEIAGELPSIDYWYVEPASEGKERTRVHKVVHFFVMKATGGDTSLHDHETEEVAMLDPARALETASYSSERETIQRALSLRPPL